MLAIRMQRTGRKGHAMFRVVVQDSRLSPTSGRVVALLGNYDPHAKTVKLDTEKASAYLNNGAQPSDRVARLLQKEGVKLPKWVVLPGEKSAKIKSPEKLRRNRPAEEKASDVAVDAEPKASPETAEAEDQAEPTEAQTPNNEQEKQSQPTEETKE